MNEPNEKIIRIPEVLMRFPIAACRFRKRIRKVLAPRRKLGELQGLRHDALFDLASPEGAKASRTLARRLAALGAEAEERRAELARQYAGKAPAPAGGGPRPAVPQPDALDWLLLDELLQTVPARYDDLALRLVPHAACINAFLDRNALETLGQLKTYDFLASNWGVGRLKLNALIDLIRQAQDDALQAGIADEREAARLVVTLADAFLKRPVRKNVNRMLRLRMLGAAANDRPWTLERIGKTFGLTRERVRQIVYESQVPGLANFGGMRLHKALVRLADFCEKHTLPVTEARFGQWLGETPHDYPIRFYLALADALAPADRLPVWAETPLVNDGHVRQVAQARQRMERLLRPPAGRPMTLAAAFDLLQGKRSSFSRKTFLAALRNHPSFTVDPEAGTLARSSDR